MKYKQTNAHTYYTDREELLKKNTQTTAHPLWNIFPG